VPPILIGLVRRFLGRDWKPDWIELPQASVDTPYDQIELAECEVKPGVLPGIAVLAADLQTRNPRDRLAESARTFSHLVELAPDGIPTSIRDVVLHLARQKLACGDLSLNSVAEQLDMGPRTLQRRLRIEGVSFRVVSNAVIAERARDLLLESDHTVEEIARSLGYGEVNSFRRAFRSCYGVSPTSYRPSGKRSGYPSASAEPC
jgi:AraC-like DNA-binding protein